MKKLIPIILIMVLLGLLLTGCPPPKEPSSGCFIATAAYGTPAAEETRITAPSPFSRMAGMAALQRWYTACT